MILPVEKALINWLRQFDLALLECASRNTTATVNPNGRAQCPPAPDTRVKITEGYAKYVGRDAYFWAWPLVNLYNRRLAFSQVKEAAKSGPLVLSPLNHIAMLTDYVAPEERSVACPNQDVVYGIGSLALDLSPVVVQGA